MLQKVLNEKMANVNNIMLSEIHIYIRKTLHIASLLIAASHFMLSETFQLVEERLQPTFIPVTCTVK